MSSVSKRFAFSALVLVLLGLPALAQQQAIQADSFVNSTGVNIHLHYTNTPYYNNWPLIRDSLVNLGVRHVRDSLVDTTFQVYYDRHNELGSLGIKGLFTTTASQSTALLQQWPSRVSQSFEAYENINEADLQSNYASVLAASVPALYSAAITGVDPTADIVGPSLTQTQSYAVVGNMSRYFTYGNLHNYVGGRNPGTAGWTPQGYGSIPFSISYEKLVSGTKPIITTETGYVNSFEHATWVPEDVMAVYMPRLYLEQWLNGIVRTYIYELLSEGNEDFGLMRADTSYKGAYLAVANMLNLLADKGSSFTPGTLNYSLQNAPSTLHHLLVQKRNGDFYLALWLEVPMYDVNPHTYITVPSVPVQLQLGESVAAASIYQLDSAGNMTANALTVSPSIALNVSDKVMFIKLQKTASTAPTWQLQTAVSPSVGGSIKVVPPAVGSKYALGSSARVIAIPNAGYVFSQFTGTIPATTPYVTATSSTASTVSETATFRCTYTLASTTATAPAAGGNNTVTYQTGSGCADRPTTSDSWLSASASSGVLTITSQSNAGVTRVGTVTLGDASLTVTQTSTSATWKLNVAITPTGGGTVTPNPSTIDYKFLPGTSVNLTATPNPGFVFQKFTGVLTSTASSVTISSNTTNSMTETANFACSFTPAFTSISIPTVSVNRSMTFTTGAGCTATPTSSVPWLTPSVSSNVLSIVSQANTGDQRVGVITLGDASITVTQSGATATWKLTTSSSPSAGGTVSLIPAAANNAYAVNTSVVLTATPNQGYAFSSFTGNYSSTKPTLTITSSSDVTEVANFTCVYSPTSTSATFTSAGGSNTIAYTTGSGCSSAPVSSASWLTVSAAGGTLSLTATANTTNSSRTATVTLGDATITATQSAGSSWTLSYSTSPTAGGSVAVSPASTNGSYPAGTTVSLNAIPNTGYAFESFTGTYSGSNPTLTITPTGATTEIANFRCTYTVSSSALSITAAGGSSTLTYATGSSCSATPGSSASWLTVTAGSGTLLFTATTNTTSNARSATVTLGDATISVTQAGGATWKLNLSATPTPGGTVNLSPTAPNNTYSVGTSVTLTAVPNTGYAFDQYTGAVNSTNTTVTITPQASLTTVATFRCTYAISSAALSIAAAGGSTTLPYTTGSTCSATPVSSASWLTATAANGVLTLSAGANNTTSQQSATVTLGDAAITVTQSVLSTWKLNLSTLPTAGGTVSLSPTAANNTYAVGASVTLTASANPGYVFTGFTGAFPSTNTSQTIAPKSSATLVANFSCTYAASSPLASFTASGGSSIIAYSTGAGCTATPTTSDTWISATAANNTLTITTQTNPGAARTGTISLGDTTVAVSQAAAGPFQITLASNIAGSLINIDGKPYPLTSTLKWNPGEIHVLGVPAAQKVNGVVYVFQQWTTGLVGTGDQTVVANPNKAVFTSQLIAGNYLSAGAATGGTITISPAGAAYGGFPYYDPSTVVTLTAIPNEGCSLMQWTGASTETTPTITLDMSSSRTAMAKFKCQ